MNKLEAIEYLLDEALCTMDDDKIEALRLKRLAILKEMGRKADGYGKRSDLPAGTVR